MNFLDPQLPDTFWAKAIPEPNSGCWLWVAAADGCGYGQFWLGGRNGVRWSTHRLTFTLAFGPIPVGLELDHKCEQPCCCNPWHLDAVTHQVNVQRGRAGMIETARTHCPHGHPYNAANTNIYRGRRYCRACQNGRGRKRLSA